MKKERFWLVVSFFTAVIIYAWVSSALLGGESPLSIRQLNRLFASLGFWFFFLQFVLSSRLKLIESGFGLNRMIHAHRLLGRLALIFLLLHPLLLFMHEGLFSAGTPFRIAGLTVLLMLMLTAFVASFHKKLKLSYELWLNIHKVNYILFPVALIHIFGNALPGSLLYYIWLILTLLFALLLVEKIIREIKIRKNLYEVVKVQQESKDIWSLYFKGKQLAYQPGQFMYLRLLRNGKLSSAHPFTISSSPTWEMLTVTPKELGDFTATIKDTKVGDLALIDAPYGIFSFLNYDCDRLAFIAGGIGITPFMSMLRYIYDERIEKQVTIIWGNKDEEALCFQEELDKMAREMENIKVVYVMSAQESWRGEKGRIGGKVIDKYVPELARCHFFVCGPPMLSLAIMKTLREKGVPGRRIHHELFEF
ncbi:MAG: ferredoxin reductase family protein [Dethiobacter sp.]|nr:ferredoxin reductase family protein [Dethiobacter sp.]MBS3899718.1 ferredoxin reductase family protein [Dethiobacter sp.]MBS3983016.1 ferredoxin reductase family protein [Dethiobacter sp.]MCL4463109.1 ferric reductase-like transmembrane domain-containing protein [Bacillota bacterium]MCL5994259.1 ferric reductase-like transmembrane domain-containing protein [Bacillota bacterium]